MVTQINLEGSGEPTMAKDLPRHIKIVKSKNLKCLCIAMGQGLMVIS